MNSMKIILIILVCVFNPCLLTEHVYANEEYLKTQLETPPKKLKLAVGANIYSILFIGNSISHHNVDELTIKDLGWDHVAGMAASDESKDYVPLFSSMIQNELHEKTIIPFIHQHGTGSISSRFSKLDQYEKLKPDIVVIQLGEHEKGSTGEIKNDFSKMLEKIQSWNKKPLILSVGVWSPQVKHSEYMGRAKMIDETMKAVAYAKNVPYASMEKHAINPDNSGTGSSRGVKWHPNDYGMKEYADELIMLWKNN